jgi:hypothetical protein
MRYCAKNPTNQQAKNFKRNGYLDLNKLWNIVEYSTICYVRIIGQIAHYKKELFPIICGLYKKPKATNETT